MSICHGYKTHGKPPFTVGRHGLPHNVNVLQLAQAMQLLKYQVEDANSLPPLRIAPASPTRTWPGRSVSPKPACPFLSNSPYPVIPVLPTHSIISGDETM